MGNTRLARMWHGRVAYWPWNIEVTPAEAKDTAQWQAAQGVNVVMLNHDHFRWNFVDIFPQIQEATAIIVEACHEEDLLVVEHHSSTATSNQGYYGGRRIEDWANRDVRTGRIGHAPIHHGKEFYAAWWCCINNPNWKEAYYGYISDFFRNANVDGLTHDDIHFAPGRFYCGCRYCREKFKGIFGYELPKGKTHPAWDNFESPIWRDWMAFRRISTGDEFVDISKVLGPDKILYGCCSVALNTTLGVHNAGYTYEDFARGANVLFMESIIHAKNETAPGHHHFYNYKRHYLDRKYYQALSEVKDSPCLAYSYPSAAEENLFCWALTKAFGHGYIRYVSEGYPYFKWESENAALFEKPKDLASIGILHSVNTMSFEGADSRYYLDELRGWTEAMIEENIPFKVVLADTEFSPRRLEGLRLLILPNVTCLSNRQTAAIKDFVRKGGNLILTHETSVRDETGERRKNFALRALIGIDYKGNTRGIDVPVYRCKQRRKNPVFEGAGERIPYHGPHAVCSLPGNLSDVSAWVEKYDLFSHEPPAPAVVEGRYHRGRFIYFSLKPGLMYATEGKCPAVNKDYSEKFVAQTAVPVAPLWIDERMLVYKVMMLNAIRSLVPESGMPFSVTEAPDGVLMNCYGLPDKSRVITFLNVSGARLRPNSRMPLRPNVRYPKLKEPIRLKLNLGPLKRASLISPDFPEHRAIGLERAGRSRVLEIPPFTLGRFLIARLTQ